MPASVRPARPRDLEAICAVHLEAFGEEEGPAIARLVRDLAADETARPDLSLVARDAGRIVGHVLFTAVRIDGAPPDVPARILAPLAVAPSRQRSGIGAALIAGGARRLAEDGVGLVFVLGHPRYYPRSGFEPALAHGLAAPHPIPDAHRDAWMVRALAPGLLGRVRGTVACARTLDRPEYW